MANRVTVVRKQYVRRMERGIPVYCGICNGQILDKKSLTVDHVIPRSKGGSNRIDNLQPAHKMCNEYKADNVGV